MVFGISIRYARYADFGEKQLARKLTRRTGISDDEDRHRWLFGMSKKRPEPARLNVGSGKRFRKETNSNAQDCKSFSFVKMLRKPGDVKAEAMTCPVRGQSIRLIRAGKNERLPRESGRMVESPGVKGMAPSTIRPVHLIEQEVVVEVGALSLRRGYANIYFVSKQRGRNRVPGFDSEPSIEAYMQANPGMPLSWEKKIKKWKAISFTPGIIHNLRLSKKTNLENGVFIGVAYAKSPGYTLTGTGSNSTLYREVTFKQTSVDAFTLSTSIRSGLHYRLHNNLGSIFSVSYNFLKPTFKDVEQTSFGITTNGGPGGISIFSTQRKFTFTQNMNTINLSVGLTYQL